MAGSIDRLPQFLNRHAFVPLVFRLSLQLEQVTWEEFVDDSALASLALRNGYQIAGADAGITWFDTLLEAEAVGAKVPRDQLGKVIGPSLLPENPDPDVFVGSVLIRTLEDVTRRVIREASKHRTILGYLTGQRTLLRMLFGAETRDRITDKLNADRIAKVDRDAFQTAAEISVRLARIYGEAGVGGIVIAEEEEIPNTSAGPFEEVINVARYYNIPLMLVSKQAIRPDIRSAITRMGISHIIDPSERPGDSWTGIPSELFGESDSLINQWAREHSKENSHRGFMSSWEIAPDVRPEALTRMRNNLLTEAPNRHV